MPKRSSMSLGAWQPLLLQREAQPEAPRSRARPNIHDLPNKIARGVKPAGDGATSESQRRHPCAFSTLLAAGRFFSTARKHLQALIDRAQGFFKLFLTLCKSLHQPVFFLRTQTVEVKSFQ